VWDAADATPLARLVAIYLMTRSEIGLFRLSARRIAQEVGAAVEDTEVAMAFLAREGLIKMLDGWVWVVDAACEQLDQCGGPTDNRSRRAKTLITQVIGSPFVPMLLDRHGDHLGFSATCKAAMLVDHRRLVVP
jgi:hypothetical protein